MTKRLYIVVGGSLHGVKVARSPLRVRGPWVAAVPFRCRRDRWGGLLSGQRAPFKALASSSC